MVSSGALSMGAVGFDADMPDPAAGVIHVTCHNRGREDITLYAPMPVGVLDADGLVYGVNVYVCERDGDGYRLFPDSGPYWEVDGRFHGVQRPIRVVAEGFKALTLDVRALNEAGIDAKALRLEFVRSDGRTVSTFETDLPERFAPRPPPAPDAPADRPAAPAPPSS